MRAVNLLPDVKGRGAERGAGASFANPMTVLIAGAGLLVAIVVLIAFADVSNHNKVSDRRETLATVQQELSDAQAKLAAARAAADASGQPEGSDLGRLTAFQAASSARVAWDQLLGDLSKVLPAGSWVSTLSMHAPPSALPAVASTDTSTATTTPTTTPVAPDLTSFQVSGVALSNSIVARVMQRLALVPMLSDVTLTSSQRADIGKRKAYQFAMNAALTPTPGVGG